MRREIKETREWITTVEHDPADRQADGRWEGTVIQMRDTRQREIRWAGLTDKNSDKLYAPKQLLPQSDYDMRDREIFERRVSKYRKLLDGAKEGIIFSAKSFCEIFFSR